MVITIILGLCFVCTTVVYCIIYFNVRRHTNQIQALQVQVAQNGENVATQRKSAVGTLYVYIVFLVCCLPDYCVRAASLISEPSTTLSGLILYSNTLMYINSSLDPVIYCWKMRTHSTHHHRHTAKYIFKTKLNIYILRNTYSVLQYKKLNIFVISITQ